MAGQELERETGAWPSIQWVYHISFDMDAHFEVHSASHRKLEGKGTDTRYFSSYGNNHGQFVAKTTMITNISIVFQLQPRFLALRPLEVERFKKATLIWARTVNRHSESRS
jgi:hypothetical protein